MFSSNTYQNRRKNLFNSIEHGLILFPGNNPVPMNYPSNHLPFRQDSNFMYYCGLDVSHLNLVLDVEKGESILFGDDLSVDEIVWEGERTPIEQMAELSGVDRFLSSSDLQTFIQKKDKAVHYLPLYRDDQKMFVSELLNGATNGASRKLIQTVIRQRSIKSSDELAEIELALDITCEMHKIAMRQTKDGMLEQSIVGAMEGFALSKGRRLAYPIIFTIHGEILHSNVYTNVMHSGQLALNDSGSESPLHYASDITRTFPVNGKFSPTQKEIYQIVYKMQAVAFDYCKPGNSYKDAHLATARVAVEGLTVSYTHLTLPTILLV